MSTDFKLSKKLKIKLTAYIESIRPYTIIWCGLVSLAGSCIAFKTFPSLNIAILVTIIPMMGWAAGLLLSDFLDRKLDEIEKPHRPIPSGKIKPKEAIIIGAIFAFTGLFLSFLLTINNIILVFIVALLVYGYARISKSHGIMGNLNRGFVTVAAFIFGVFSFEQPVYEIPIYIWLLCFVFLIHDTNSNLVGAIRDMEGDKKGGYLTIPVKYGLKKSILISFVLTILWLSITIFTAYYYQFLKIEFFYVMIIDILIMFSLYIYLINSVKNYSRKKALKFHEFFVMERIVLASAFIFGIANVSTAASILIVAILITGVTQYFLRKRYEFEESNK